PGSLVQYSFCPVRYEATYPVPADHAFVIAASGVLAEKTANALESYNRLSRRAAAAAEAWRLASGRNDRTLGDAVAAASFPEIRRAIARTPVTGFVPQELVERFDQFYNESEVIIPAVGETLTNNALDTLGEWIERSQEGAERLLGNQIAETRSLAREARVLGATAARASGAGFGGSVWALVSAGDAERFMALWREDYLGRFPAHRTEARFFL